MKYIIIFIACLGGLIGGYYFGKYMPNYILIPTTIILLSYVITEFKKIYENRNKY